MESRYPTPRDLVEALQQRAGGARAQLGQFLLEPLGRLLDGLAERHRLPADNLELERWFKLPKRHARHIHGRAHAGVRLVQEGPTLLPTLNAHELHPVPFAAEDLQAYRDAPMPACQRDALHRRKVMRHARSAKQRPRLLAELERRYQNDP